MVEQAAVIQLQPHGACRTFLIAAAASLCLSLTATAAPLAAPQDEPEDNFRPRPFQLYDTQAARALADRAADHITAGRWSEAIEGLQTLVVDHRGEVLGAERPRARVNVRLGRLECAPGASSWAAQQLFNLPEPGKALMHARAGTIEYYKAEDRVHMRDDARIEQDGAIVRGNTIDYFIEEQLVKADSISDQADNRVEVVIPASATREEDE